jgi:hypothetical protein
MAVAAGFARVSRHFADSPAGLYRSLQDAWLSRLVREPLKLFVHTPLRTATLAFVNCTLSENPETGCVMAICHTPWFRLLAEWCRARDFAAVIAGEVLLTRTGTVNGTGRVLELRRVVRHLRNGGRVVVIADVFHGSHRCAVRFFEKNRFASLLPARLAAFAGVPLQIIIPALQARQLHICAGPTFTVGASVVEQQRVTQDVLTYFEKEIRQRPALLARFSGLP